MKHRIAFTLSGLAFAALAAGAPQAFSQQDQTAPQTANQQTEQTQPATQGFNHIRVAAGSELVGKPVRDRDGYLVGEVEYLLIDPASGRVTNLVVGAGEMLADQFRLDGMRAVPWNQVMHNFSNQGEIRTLGLQIARSDLEKAPRIDANAIESLTSPSVQATITEYFAPLSPPDNQAAANSADSGDTTGSTSQPDASAEAGTQTQQQSGQADTQTAGQAPDTQQQGNQQQGIQQNQEASPAGHLLVGRSIVTALLPPDFQLARQMRGATVRSADGQELGEVMRLVIDVERGRVAYALVSFGGFLGTGSEVRAVPVQAFDWQNDSTVKLGMTAAQYAQTPRIDPDRFPSVVSRADLEKLYQAYGVKAYWTTEG